MTFLNPNLYKRLARPFFFLLEPEKAQKITHVALKQSWAWEMLAPTFEVKDPRLKTKLCGIQLDSPVGIAAGFDKNCEMLASLSALGFGYLVGGTVTVNPRMGNQSPRLLRLTDKESLINSLGFPNKGLDQVEKDLRSTDNRHGSDTLILSISGTSIADMLSCHRRLEPLARAIEVNISSPNTAGLRTFHNPNNLARLLATLNEKRKKPLMVKLPPYPSLEKSGQVETGDKILNLVQICLREGVEAVTAANSLPVNEPKLAAGSGGLSGKLVFDAMIRMVSDIKAEVADNMSINACGGISTTEDAWLALQSGATTVQLYTGMVYQGPGIAKNINQGLARLMEKDISGHTPI